MASSQTRNGASASPPAERIAHKLWREVARPIRQLSHRVYGPSARNASPAPPSDSTDAAKPYLTGTGATIGGFHPQQATVEPEGIPLVQSLVRRSRNYPGPIIEVGTLLGITTTTMALAKAPEQKIITVDLYCWNPWGVTPDVHEALTSQVLHYLVQTGHVERVRMDKNEYYRTYRGPAPAMVFLDAMHDYEETKKDIEWARQIGAKIIAGHDYCDAFAGVKQIVDEKGGPRKLAGTVWALWRPVQSFEAVPHGAPADDGETMAKISFSRSETPGLVSIVIPTHRGERYIGETLESIGRQTYKQWEVIVVEDGSTGPTQKIVESFARRFPNNRVDYSRNATNCGASHSRNVGFEKSAGEFVALVDCDDRWFPTHLAESVDAFRTSSKDIVYASVIMVEDRTEMLLGVWGPEPQDVVKFPLGLFNRNFVTPSATVMRRSVLADIGPWETNLRYCEDLGFWMRCVAAGKQFLHIGGCHCLYRKNQTGATTAKMGGTLEEFAQIVERYIGLPGAKVKSCRNSASKAYVRAAEAHVTGDPKKDPSADPTRAARLWWKAWLLRPKRVKYLSRAIYHGAANWFRKPRQVTADLPGVPLVTAVPLAIPRAQAA